MVNSQLCRFTIRATALAVVPSGKGAELGNGSLQGNYFLTLHKTEASVLGFLFTNAVGTLAFDGNGRLTAQGAINRNGSVQLLNASGTYALDAAGASSSAVSQTWQVSFKADWGCRATVWWRRR